MATLLEQMKAKREAKAKAEAAKAEPVETKTPEPIPQKEIGTSPSETDGSANVLMGITVEDLQERINHVYEMAKSNGDDIQDGMNGLKKAIHANPEIVQNLLPEDIGKMVGVLRKLHSSARTEAQLSPQAKKASKSAETKAAKAMLKKPLSKEDLDSLMDEL